VAPCHAAGRSALGSLAEPRLTSGTLSQAAGRSALGSLAKPRLTSGTLGHAAERSALGNLAKPRLTRGTLGQAAGRSALGSLAEPRLTSGTLWCAVNWCRSGRSGRGPQHRRARRSGWAGARGGGRGAGWVMRRRAETERAGGTRAPSGEKPARRALMAPAARRRGIVRRRWRALVADFGATASRDRAPAPGRDAAPGEHGLPTARRCARGRPHLAAAGRANRARRGFVAYAIADP